MSALVEMIQKIGIFLIAAQAVVHFAPGTAYAKYMKMIVSIIVLLMFISPVYQIITGDILTLSSETNGVEMPELSMEWKEMESYIEIHSLNRETLMEQMEEEIKTRLYSEISVDNLGKGIENETYEIIEINIEETDPVSLQVVLEKKMINDQNRTDHNIDTIRIPEIVVGENREENKTEVFSEMKSEKSPEEEKEHVLSLRQRFANILGLEEEQVEVIVYGAD